MNVPFPDPRLAGHWGSQKRRCVVIHPAPSRISARSAAQAASKEAGAHPKQSTSDDSGAQMFFTSQLAQVVATHCTVEHRPRTIYLLVWPPQKGLGASLGEGAKENRRLSIDFWGSEKVKLFDPHTGNRSGSLQRYHALHRTEPATVLSPVTAPGSLEAAGTDQKRASSVLTGSKKNWGTGGAPKSPGHF